MPIQRTNRVLKQYQADVTGFNGRKFVDLVDSFGGESILAPIAQFQVNLQYGDAQVSGDLQEVKSLLDQVDKGDSPHNFTCTITSNSNPRRNLTISVSFGQRMVTFQGQGFTAEQGGPLLAKVEKALPEVKGSVATPAPDTGAPDAVDFLPGAFKPIPIPTVSDRDVFVIMSFAREHRDAYHLAIEPLLKSKGFNPIRVDEIQHNTTVTVEIIRQIEKAAFVVADLTGERPNVYYEVGYAHRADKEVILVARKDSAVHFDVAAINRIDYEDYTELKEALEKRVRAISERLGLDSLADEH